MYPKHFLDYFREFETTDEVFVAMPFEGDAADHRWRNVFQPAIRTVGLEPFRVDVREVSDSILTDILQGIGRARLVLGDVSAQGVTALGRDRVRRPNPNALYELGIAHAARLETEVVVVRAEPEEGEEDRVPFDLLHIRYRTFDPSVPEAAAEQVSGYLEDALGEVDRTKDLIVKRTLRRLDDEAKAALHMYWGEDGIWPWYEEREGGWERRTREGCHRLLELGILRAEYPDDLATIIYRFTALGEAVADHLDLEPR